MLIYRFTILNKLSIKKRRFPMARTRILGAPLFAVLLGFALFISVAYSQQPVEWTQCFSGTATIGAATDELRVFTIDSKGIVMSNLESRISMGILLYWRLPLLPVKRSRPSISWWERANGRASKEAARLK